MSEVMVHIDVCRTEYMSMFPGERRKGCIYMASNFSNFLVQGVNCQVD